MKTSLGDRRQKREYKLKYLFGNNCNRIPYEVLSDTVISARNIFIHKKYFDGKTFHELGKEYGISHERVRQIVRRVTRVIRDGMEGNEKRI